MVRGYWSGLKRAKAQIDVEVYVKNSQTEANYTHLEF